MHIEVGLTVAPRGQVTLGRTLGSLVAAGFARPRLFCDGPVEVPEEYAVTRREPAIGGWPNFWLGLTELLARNPNADAYLMVQDDVVFCRDVAAYLANWQPPVDCGVISLFTPACNNGPSGWHPFAAGYGMAGAQALLFPRDRAFDFLAHPWTVNHRRAAPASKHYRGDGLHHIDGVVGEWCKLVRRRAFCHSPSLSQHIGETSVMYPGFTGKQDRRFANTFPGEDATVMNKLL
ncbi:MAG: hypothetical protein R3C18_10190 [Planctomycetaceae bacterium]